MQHQTSTCSCAVETAGDGGDGSGRPKRLLRRRRSRIPGRRWPRRSSTAVPWRTAARSWRSTHPTARRTRLWCRSTCAACCRQRRPSDRRYHTCDRRKPLAAGRRVHAGRIERDAVAVHPGARRFLHQPACGGGTERRATLRGRAVRQGRRRLLGAGGEAGGGRHPARHNAVSAVRARIRRRPGPRRGAAPDPSPELFRDADGSGHPPLHAGALREVGAHLAGRGAAVAIESGISISENPGFRFDYRPNGATSFSAEMEDSDGRSFRQEWPATPT